MCLLDSLCAVYERETDTDTDAWFSVKTTDPYTRKEWGGGGVGQSAHILHFNIIFDDLSMRKIETERDRQRQRVAWLHCKKCILKIVSSIIIEYTCIIVMTVFRLLISHRNLANG